MDNIGHILSPEALKTDWDTLSTNISNAIAQVKELTLAAKEITFTIKGDDLLGMVERQRKFENAIKDSDNALANITKQFQNLSATSQEYGNITTQLIKKQSEYKTEIIENERLIAQYKASIVSAEDSMRRFGSTTSVNKPAIDAFKQSIAENREKIAELERSLTKARIEMQSLTPEINAASKGFRSQVGSIDELDARVKILTIDYKQLNETQKNSVGGKQLLADIQELNVELGEERAQLKGVGTELLELSKLEEKEVALSARLAILKTDEAKAVALLNVQNQQQSRVNKLTAQETLAVENSYKEMSAELALLDIKLKNYTLEQIKNGETTDYNIIRYKELVASLKEYDAILGINTRNVGNYKSVLAPLAKMKLELVDIERKLASGELEEGETVAILTARYAALEIEAKKVVTAQNKVNDSLKTGKSVVQQFGEMFSRQLLRAFGSLIIFSVLFAAFEKLWKLFTEGTDKTIALRKEIEDYNTKLRELGDTTVAEAAKEEAAAKILVSSALSVTNSLHSRIEAINELRKTYKGLFEDYSDEQMMNDKTIAGYANLNKAIALKASIKANEGKLEESAKVYAEAQDKIDDLEGLNKRAEAYKSKRISELEKNYDSTHNSESDEYQELNELKIGTIPIEKLFENTAEGRLEKSRLEKRSMFDKMFDKGTVNISEQKDQIKEQQSIQELALKNENEYLNRAQTQAEKLDKLKESKKKNIVELKAELASLKSTIESRNLPQDVLDKFYDNSVDKKGFDKFLKSKKGTADAIETQKLREEYYKKETKIRLLENELVEPKGRHREGKNAGNRPDLTAEFELEKQRLNNVIEINRQIVDDSKESLDKRLIALRNYYNAEKELEQVNYSRQLSENQNTINNARQKIDNINSGKDGVYKKGEKAKELKIQYDIIKDAHVREIALTEEFGYKNTQIQNKIYKDTTKIYTENESNLLQSKRNDLAQELLETTNAYLAQELAIDEGIKNGDIRRKDGLKQIDKLQTELHKKLMLDEIKFWEDLLGSTDELIKTHVTEIDNRIKNLKKGLIDSDGDVKKKKKEDWLPTDPIVDALSSGKDIIDKDGQDRTLEMKKDFYAKTVDLAKNAFDAINTIRNNAFEAEQKQLQIQSQQLQIQSNQKMQALEASAGYEVEIKNKESLLASQTAAKQSEIQTKQNQEAVKQAIANKQAAETSITLSTASAIMGTVASFATKGLLPEFAPLMAAMIALEVGTGAAQFAAASSAPIPQFWTGGTTKTPIFSAGEKGFELIEPAGGGNPYFSTNTAAVYNEPIGTKISSHEKTLDIVNSAVYNVLAKQVPDGGIGKANFAKDVAKELALLIGDRFDESTENLAYVIKTSRPIVNNHIKNQGNNLNWNIKN